MEAVLGISSLKCPLRGLRAPEICSGEFFSFIERMLEYQSCEVIFAAAAHLSEADKTRLVMDWSRLKVHMKMQLEYKLSPFTALPLLVLGLGHFDEETARQVMWRAGSQWEGLTDEEKSAAHPLSRELFAGGLRHELVEFLRGGAIATAAELASLRKLRERTLWTPVLEQSIERKHAQLHARIKAAPAHSAPYVSVVERGPELEELLVSQPDVMQRLSEFCSSIRQPDLVAQVLGMNQRPAFEHRRAQQPGLPLPHHLVAACVYRTDVNTQYSALAPLADGPQPPPKALPFEDGKEDEGDEGCKPVVEGKGGAEASGLALAAGGVHGGLWESIIEQLTFKHFCTIATAELFFSCPISEVGKVSEKQLQPLTELTRPGRRSFPAALFKEVLDQGIVEGGARAVPVPPRDSDTDHVCQLEFEDDSGVLSETHEHRADLGSAMLVEAADGVDGSDVQIAQAQARNASGTRSHAFFRLLSAGLSSKKRSRTDCTISLTKEHVAIQRHPVLEVDSTAREVHVALDSDRLSTDVDVWKRPAPETLKTFLKWKVRRPYYTLKTGMVPAHAQTAFDALVKHFLLDSSLVLHEGTEEMQALQDGLKVLQGMHVAEVHDSGKKSTWTFSDQGRSQLVQNVVLADAVSVGTSREGVALKDQTPLELLLFLRGQGWCLNAHKSRSAEPKCFDVLSRQPKVVHARPDQKELKRGYLLALASPAAALTSDEVRHFQTNDYYAELLGHGASRRRRKGGKDCLAIFDDSGVHQAVLLEAPKKASRPKKSAQRPEPSAAVEDIGVKAAIKDTVEASVEAVEPAASAEPLEPPVTKAPKATKRS
jgi:hypothetical protein